MGSPAVAAFIVRFAFWALLVYGVAAGELRARGVGAFLLAWLGGRFLLAYAPYGAALFPPFVAVLDIALVFAIFKGGVRLTWRHRNRLPSCFVSVAPATSRPMAGRRTP